MEKIFCSGMNNMGNVGQRMSGGNDKYGEMREISGLEQGG